MQTVISVGIDQELLLLREAVLRSAGFKVVTAWNARSARLHLANTPAEVLLLCYSLPLTVRQELAEEFRRRSQNGRIVVITNEANSVPAIKADAFIYGIEGPETPIRACRRKRSRIVRLRASLVARDYGKFRSLLLNLCETRHIQP